MQQRHASPDLNLLEALDALLREQNVTRAAAQLGISQSAMSHKLARLRDVFGDPLLVGGRGGMVPTPEAERIGRSIKQAFIDLRAAMLGNESFDPATSKRRFVMVSPDYAAFSFLPRARALLSKEGPATSLVVREPWPGMVDALRDGTLDLVAGADLPPAAGLIRTKLFQDELVCVVRRDHPRVAQSFDLETFAALPHLLVTRDPEGTGPIDVALATHGLQRHIAMRVPYHLAAPFIVARSDLVMMTTLALAKDAATMLPLRILPCPIPLPVLKVTVAWHERNQNDPANRWIRDITIRCATGVHDGSFPKARTRKRSAKTSSPSTARRGKRS
ncbi:MAG TPA: LysR family transcriptional regulator [Polyangiaceae bacterium]|jgi:DNA-binding transcriptional LysR family regulator|nr:LysR family transcriptional regulator [Polyangiaceae bacterium]